MPKIVIISSSIRNGRRSHRVANYFDNLIRENSLAEVEILDLLKYNFPLFHERLKYLESPPASAVDFANKVKSADGVLIVTPEYNGGYPASLKNVVDLLTDSWNRKPVAFVTVSDGDFGGTQVITSIQFSFWKIGALTVPVQFRVPNILTTFDENGVPADKPTMDKRAHSLIRELLWFIESKKSISE